MMYFVESYQQDLVVVSIGKKKGNHVRTKFYKHCVFSTEQKQNNNNINDAPWNPAFILSDR